MSTPDKIETKLSAARTRLIIDKPFLGALVLRLPMEEGDPSWCKTTATDAKTFYYNRNYIAALSNEQTQFILAHEALHCALSHFARRQHRIKHRWDLACDFAINPLLINDGLKPPPDALFERNFDGMTAEEIYPYMDDFENQETHDQHLYDEENESKTDNRGETPPPPKPETKTDKTDQSEGQGNQQQTDRQQGSGNRSEAEVDEQQGGAPQPPPLSHQEKEQLSVQWQQRLAGAAQTALQSGKLAGQMARLVDFLLQPQLPWRSLLARYMNSIARDDYSYTRPSTRRGDPAIYPSLRSAQIELLIALDTSGSIGSNELQEFVSEVDAIKGQMRARVTLLACDSELVGGSPWVFEPWEEFSLPKDIYGGGGTRFNPVFEWANQQDRKPDLLVYFTDAQGAFPKLEPEYPVLWLVKGKTPVPWGQRVQLN